MKPKRCGVGGEPAVGGGGPEVELGRAAVQRVPGRRHPLRVGVGGEQRRLLGVGAEAGVDHERETRGARPPPPSGRRPRRRRAASPPPAGRRAARCSRRRWPSPAPRRTAAGGAIASATAEASARDRGSPSLDREPATTTPWPAAGRRIPGRGRRFATGRTDPFASAASSRGRAGPRQVARPCSGGRGWESRRAASSARAAGAGRPASTAPPRPPRGRRPAAPAPFRSAPRRSRPAPSRRTSTIAIPPSASGSAWPSDPARRRYSAGDVPPRA